MSAFSAGVRSGASGHGGASQQNRERGAVAVWTLLLASGAFTILLGLVVDGGNVVDARLEAKRVAEQAARAGADELSAVAVRSGADNLDAGRARDRARDLAAQSGWQATVEVDGTTVRVTVSGTTHTQFLGVLGIQSFPVKETGAARAVTAPAPTAKGAFNSSNGEERGQS